MHEQRACDHASSILSFMVCAFSVLIACTFLLTDLELENLRSDGFLLKILEFANSGPKFTISLSLLCSVCNFWCVSVCRVWLFNFFVVL